MEPSQTPPNAPRRFFGALLMAVGGLLAGLSGLCTLGGIVVMTTVAQGEGGPNWISALPAMIGMPLMFGALPIALGLALFFWGRSLRRG